MHILLVEDDNDVASYIASGLKERGHIVEWQSDGKEALVRASSEVYDLIVLDRMLPSVDGLKIVNVLRATDDRTPVLLLSALSDVDERVKGLQAGADDYLSKPFAMSELLARVEALARRGSASATDEQTVLRFADLEINLIAHTAQRSGKRIDLTQREFRFLEYLVRNAGRVVTRSMLLENLWDYNFDPQTNIIDQHVSRLRTKLESGGRSRLIHTLRGVGYIVRQ
jgi:two-component system, OmpR family, response regulator